METSASCPGATRPWASTPRTAGHSRPHAKPVDRSIRVDQMTSASPALPPPPQQDIAQWHHGLRGDMWRQAGGQRPRRIKKQEAGGGTIPSPPRAHREGLCSLCLVYKRHINITPLLCSATGDSRPAGERTWHWKVLEVRLWRNKICLGKKKKKVRRTHGGNILSPVWVTWTGSDTQLKRAGIMHRIARMIIAGGGGGLLGGSGDSPRFRKELLPPWSDGTAETLSTVAALAL